MTRKRRYLWGPAVDQLLATDLAGSAADNQVMWTLTDHQGTVRDLANFNGVSTSIWEHARYDSFGNKTYDEKAYYDHLFAYTGRMFDPDTGLQWNLNRWYDSKVGRWLSEDPISFEGGDANLYRYVGNSPVNGVDPDGLERGSWGESGWWRVNPWTWSIGPRQFANLLAGNSDIYAWDADANIKDGQRRLWEKGRELGQGDWRYDIYHDQYYEKPLGESHAGVACGLAEAGAGSYGAAFGACRTVVPYSLPSASTLDDVAARRWYHNQLDKIPSKIDPNLPLRKQAEQAFRLRNQAKVEGRRLMENRVHAAELERKDPIPTFEQMITKARAKGYRGDDVWTYIRDSSSRSRDSVDRNLGLSRQRK